MPSVQIATLQAAAVERLRQSGAGLEDAKCLVEHMLTADLWGRTSHGLSVRYEQMLRLAKAGVGESHPRLDRDLDAVALIDGCGGFGYVAAKRCLAELTARVRDHGLAAVALRGARHTGMMGYYADQAARAGIVTLAFAHCRPLMAPAGGARARLGTNPLTFGFPASPHPIIVDTATSAISYGDLMVAEQRGTPIPPGKALDGDGRWTCDPRAARKGALVPFGEHRGGALAVAVQCLAGVLTSAAVFPAPDTDYGLLMVGLRKGLFSDDDTYDAAVAEFVSGYLETPELPGETVRLPGAKRYENARRTLDQGVITIPDRLADLLGLQ
ncbi:MAG: Ldh family oxidoreductase [Lentisphaerae bacterium]|jgi:LDH2 family malate/lactate/ureidoglycolate dehydrogenase|nr:Ldh family oxidoreductase [Lentisphaerota bacterium]MBT4815960.1 Ldh family oxidoreductase [Lentisphaerota bacterium]MBT5605925.1 Ldh family oxidoreductase [Lentisphaerota bacterium]MBT7058004.1 Ldh family oxidoreductase [Lentisphaerota bacterium]MBT7848559.1 Ldh family oxidoreductase [Lentisphaerota bacterium]